MAIEKKTFLFNAKNGAFTANLTETLKENQFIMDSLDLTKFKVKEVEFDNTTHYWEGDYNTGSVKPMHDKTIVKESEVNSLFLPVRILFNIFSRASLYPLP